MFRLGRDETPYDIGILADLGTGSFLRREWFMSRIVRITAPDSMTPAIVNKIHSTGGIMNVSTEKANGESTVITTVLLDSYEGEFLLNVGKLLGDENVFTVISEPSGVISSKYGEQMANDSSESSWEEMEFAIAKESNATANAMALTLVSGFIATIGIAQNALHIVIAAMVITPGFMPFVRMGLGIVAKSRSFRRGLISAFKLYVFFLIGAIAASALLLKLGTNPVGQGSSYLSNFALVTYWRNITIESLMISSAASIAGVLLIATRRSVLTSGVMIALALVPSAAILAIGMTVLDFNLAMRGLARFLIEVALILSASILVLYYKKFRIHKRNMLGENRLS